jgi:hypothetical protein
MSGFGCDPRTWELPKSAEAAFGKISTLADFSPAMPAPEVG